MRSTVTERETFEEALGTLVRVASRNGVDVVGGCEVRSEADPPDFEIQVTELSKPGD